ncbi:hypothetical protein [Methylocystis sp.]|uniref:hypothetical protein n=1 Tax=Methylocystis sp. TaxID=1911079 RepID=UPI0025EA68F7|nr:hypothetical protein [Methylocystis sp.]
MSIIGVDIGVHGALALLSPDGELLEVADMPILRDGPKGRPAVNGPLLADLVYRWHTGHAFIELVGPRPGEGAVGAFSFGRSRGLVEGVLAACGVPATLYRPLQGNALWAFLRSATAQKTRQDRRRSAAGPQKPHSSPA